MIEPTIKDIGREVIYTGNHNGPVEYGIITSFNAGVVFVSYKNSEGGRAFTSKATSRSDLEWKQLTPGK